MPAADLLLEIPEIVARLKSRLAVCERFKHCANRQFHTECLVETDEMVRFAVEMLAYHVPKACPIKKWPLLGLGIQKNI
jgi:hypothetical protein